MKRFLTAFVCVFILTWCAACGNSSGSPQASGVTIVVANSFSAIDATAAPITLTAKVFGDPHDLGLTWTLSSAGAACSPGCGTLAPATPPSLSAVYTPPASAPLNEVATITARALADDKQAFIFNFQISPPISVSIAPKFSSVNVAGPAQNLTATVANDTGVNWTLTAGGVNCQAPTQGCGTLTVDPGSLTAHYQPPLTPPSAANASATITAASVKDANKKDSFTFSIITPAITVSITNKFQSVLTAGQDVTLNASITNDFLNQGVTWTLTAGGVNCQTLPQGCGTLITNSGSPLTVQYQPPDMPPSAANASPTITATSVADPTKSDSFTFNIVTPPITVSITNKFQAVFIGGQAITLNAKVTSDFKHQGVTWTMTLAGGGACDATCGTLTFVTPSLSATYTPPATLTGTAPSPTITAISVTDPTKNDSFTFSLTTASSFLKGNYALLLRGYDKSLQPMALAGSITTDGLGNITGGEYDLNDNTTVTSASGISGTYTVDSSFNAVPRVQFNITSTAGNIILKSTFSADGKRGKVIEQDGTLALNAGSLLLQDPSAVSGLGTSTTSTSFAFGLDSDAPLDHRVAEAGQFILGAGATSITGGLADEGEAGTFTTVFGGVPGAAAIAASPSSSATAPDTLGRGTLSLSIGGNATKYAYYVVDGSQLNLIEIDTGGTLKTVQAGTARKQNALSASSIQTTSVVALTGMSDLGGGVPSPQVIIGVLSNVAGAPAAATYDEHDSFGNISFTLPANPTITFDPTTGRGVISSAFIASAVVYLYDTGSGYMVDVTTTVGNRGVSGPMMLQSAPPGGTFTLGVLSGNSIGVGGATATSAMTNLDFAASYDGGGNLAADFDFTLPNLNVGSSGQGQNVQFTGGIYKIDDPVLGHGVVSGIPTGFFDTFPNANNDKVSFYIIGPNQFVAIEVEGFTTPPSTSSILFFEPQ